MAQIEETTYRTPYGTDPIQGQYIEQIRVGEGYAPGEASFMVDATGYTGDELAFMLQVNEDHDVEVEIGLGRNFGNIESELRTGIESIAGQAGIQGQLLLNQVRTFRPDINFLTETEVLKVPVGSADEWNRTIDFEPLTIPVPEGTSIIDQINEDMMPQVEITVTAQPDSWLHTWQETFRFTLDPEALIREVELDASCGELYSDLKETLDKLPNRVQGKISGAESARSTLQDYSNQAATEGNVSTDGNAEDIADRLRELPQSVMTNVGFSRGDVIGTNSRLGDAEDLREQAGDLRTRIQDQVSPRCSDEFLQQLEQVDGDLNRLESIASDAQALKDSLLSLLPEGGLECGAAFSEIQDDVESLRSDIGVDQQARLSELSIGRDQISNYQSRASQIESQIDSTIPENNKCRAEFRSQLDDLQSILSRLQSGVVSDLDCSNVPSNIRTVASSIQGRVSTFTTRDQLARLPDRKEELLSEVNSAISDVESGVDDRNPCKRQLLSRLRQAQSNLQSAPVRPETAVPCEDRHQQIGQQLEEFEDQILSLTPPLGPEQVQNIAQQGNTIADSIDQQISSDDPCRQEMASRVENLIGRAENMVTRIRISTEGETGEEERRQELIEQLLSSIETLSNVRDRDSSNGIDGDLSGDIPTT